ncbi:hypothetical protein [Myxococcus eversor]|uniref:hypothetical protein n=1 Tax=Myxococcus eversor TaxID=2709661 RepID=UPI0013D4C00C|nr:hypothetical protein [Myxococcus eversor]
MRHIIFAIVASLLFTGCSNYWWAVPFLPIARFDHPSTRSNTQPAYREPPPAPSSEPVYGPAPSSDAPAAEKEESKAAEEAQ